MTSIDIEDCMSARTTVSDLSIATGNLHQLAIRDLMHSERYIGVLVFLT